MSRALATVLPFHRADRVRPGFFNGEKRRKGTPAGSETEWNNTVASLHLWGSDRGRGHHTAARKEDVEVGGRARVSLARRPFHRKTVARPRLAGGVVRKESPSRVSGARTFVRGASGEGGGKKKKPPMAGNRVKVAFYIRFSRSPLAISVV